MSKQDSRKSKNKTENPTYLESVANEILSKYRRLDSVLSHAPTKGTYHEKILRDVIRNYLPSTFSTGEGFVINLEGKTTSQMDVLIVDNLDPRSFGYKDNDFFVASDIAVTSFGEVKTYCKRNEFITAFHNLVNASLILGGDNAARVTSFLFCYDAYATKETFAKWTDIAISKLPNRSSTKTWNYPDYIFCLKKQVMLQRKQENGSFRYWNITSKDPSSNMVQQKIVESLIQCITDGCGRIRMLQGIKPLSR